MGKEQVITNFFEPFIEEFDHSGLVKIAPSIHQNKVSDWSKCFSNQKRENEHEKEDVIKIISEVFDQEIAGKYKEQLLKAISGAGNEYKRFTRLHSSSLCAFLHFYTVSKENPIMIDGVLYDEIHFEVENTCISPNRPSSMDIVLLSQDKKVLFLESKFAEYFNGSQVDISKEYEMKYKKFFGELGNQITNHIKYDEVDVLEDGVKKRKLRLSKSINNLYVGGIKQMISHFISLQNVTSKNEIKGVDGYLRDKYKKGYSFTLGEIVFDFNDDNRYMKNYIKEYRSLRETLPKDVNFRMLDSVLTYQDLFNESNHINNTIKKFYKYQ